MATLPTDPAQLLAFVTSRGPRWVEHAAELGLSPQMVAELEAALAGAGGAWERVMAARQESAAATTAYYNETDKLYRASAAIVRTVRGNALNSGDAGLYALASIRAPKARRKRALPPGQPYDLRATLIGTANGGTLQLTWKSKNPRGVANVNYEVARLIAWPDGRRERSGVIGLGTGTRTFVDATLPAGVAEVEYTVQPIRGRQRGPASQPLAVQFGAGEGERVTGVTRLAA